jgi:hypothetical protein
MNARLRSITPLIPTGGRLDAAIAFYTEHMGFFVTWFDGSMAGIERDDIAFNLVENDNQAWADNASFSIGVSDLEALYEEYRDVPANVGPLEMKSWGRREFHMIVPSGVCLQFYQWRDPTVEPTYYDLVIVTTSPSTEIWLGDDRGSLVQHEVGTLETSLLPGDYVVEFCLGTTTYPIHLASSSRYTQEEIEAGPTCPRPEFAEDE